MTLRDEIAAVLGPGNDDATAYAQADAVFNVLSKHPHLAFSVRQGHLWQDICNCDELGSHALAAGERARRNRADRSRA